MNYTKKQLEYMIEQQKNSMYAERRFYLDKIAKLEKQVRDLERTVNGYYCDLTGENYFGVDYIKHLNLYAEQDKACKIGE